MEFEINKELFNEFIVTKYKTKNEDNINFEKELLCIAIENNLKRFMIEKEKYKKDLLTGVCNFGVLENRIYNILNNEQMKKINMKFACYDIKDMRKYLDFYGLTEGDKKLIELANVLKSNYKEETIYRFGGEEFVVDISEQKYKKIENIKEIAVKKSIVDLKIDLSNFDSNKRNLLSTHLNHIVISIIHLGIMKATVKCYLEKFKFVL